MALWGMRDPLEASMHTTSRVVLLALAISMANASQAAGEDLAKSTPGQKALRGAMNLSLGLVLELPANGIRVSLEPDLLRVGTTWVAEARLPGYVHRYHFHVEGKRIVVR